MDSASKKSSLWIIAFLLILSLGVASRFARIGDDPPPWFQEVMTDEGWWADSARGKVLFDDYYADDFGTGFLVTPLYTWTLEILYRAIGVGLRQTRALAAISSLLTILLAAFVAARFLDKKFALFAMFVLIVSPFFWAHGRVALVEPYQALLLFAAFALWLLARRSLFACFASGLCVAAAAAAKPNAIVIGMFAMPCVIIATYILEHPAVFRNRFPMRERTGWPAAPIFLAGFLAGIGAVYLFHILPNHEKFWWMLHAESQVSRAGITLLIHVPGHFLLSAIAGTHPVIWRAARWSPALIALAWLCALAWSSRPREKLAPQKFPQAQAEILTLIWTVATLLTVVASFDDRRFLSIYPGMAILGCFQLNHWLAGRKAERIAPPTDAPQCACWSRHFIAWAVLSIPLAIILKPYVASLVVAISRQMSFRDGAGVSFKSGGTVFMAAWLVVVILITAWTTRTRRRLPAISAPVGATFVALLLIYETTTTARFFIQGRPTVLDAQARLAERIEPGSVVLGHWTATMFQDLPVYTVRRTRPEDHTPPPNPDVYDRLEPLYIMETNRINFGPSPPIYGDLIELGSYELMERFEAGPVRNGVSRYAFSIYIRPESETPYQQTQ